jgi:vacuolar-type H+-ATPase subunit B/Vma2
MFVLAGCGGGGPVAFSPRGDVSGVVVDKAGYVVQDAQVSVDADHAARSNTSGVYVLSDLPESQVTIHAEATRDDEHLSGQGVASVAAGVRTKDVNITVYPTQK